MIAELLDPRLVGLLVHSVEGRDALGLQHLGNLLVGEDHQHLYQGVGLGLLGTLGGFDVAI